MPNLTSTACINSFIGELKYNLFTRWAGMTPTQRSQAVKRAIGRTMTMAGVPAPTVIIKGLPPMECGCFNPFNQWSITVNGRHFPNGGMNVGQAFPALAISVAETIYHEMRHCEQFWHVARYLATTARSPGFLAKSAKSPVLRKLPVGSQVAKNEGAAYIRKQTQMPITIASKAMNNPMKNGDPMERLAQACFESVYGRSNRSAVMIALTLKPRQIPGQPEQLLEDFRSRSHKTYSGGLPEEADAWAIERLIRQAMGG